MVSSLRRNGTLLAVGLVALVLVVSMPLTTPLVTAHENTATGHHHAICTGPIAGPHISVITGDYAALCGGLENYATGYISSIIGGSLNVASGSYATVGGGYDNTASGSQSSIIGGAGNAASGRYATIGGGVANEASNESAHVGGGYGNKAMATYASVGGGAHNTAGAMATVPGGANNDALGNRSFAAGFRAKAKHTGAFVWADAKNENFLSTRENEFSVRATGGTRIVSAINSSGAPTAGVRLAPGSGSWSSLSDRNAKANFAAVDGRTILEQLASIPIQAWNYKSQDASIRHIGPTAQDFAAAFNVGEDTTSISTVDADGVALAAIQGLYQQNLELVQQNRDLQARVTTLEQTESGARSAALGGLNPWVLLALVVGAVDLTLLLVVAALLLRRRGAPAPSV